MSIDDVVVDIKIDRRGDEYVLKVVRLDLNSVIFEDGPFSTLDEARDVLTRIKAFSANRGGTELLVASDGTTVQ